MNLITQWGIRLLLLAGLVSGAVFVHMSVSDMRAQVYERYLELVRGPEDVAHAESLKASFAKRKFDIERIEGYVLRQENIADAVEEIERLGEALQVDATVSNIDPVVRKDGVGAPIPPAEPVEEIRLRIVANGDASDLLEFAHRIEHNSYLRYLDQWSLTTAVRQNQGTSSAAPEDAASERRQEIEATLELDVIMFVHFDE